MLISPFTVCEKCHATAQCVVCQGLNYDGNLGHFLCVRCAHGMLTTHRLAIVSYPLMRIRCYVLK